MFESSDIVFQIEQTCDLEHYVVQVAYSPDREWDDISDPFDTYQEAEEWAKKLNRRFHVIGGER